MSHKLEVSEAATRRLAWHPELDNLLAVVAKDKIALINVPPTSGVFAYTLVYDSYSMSGSHPLLCLGVSSCGVAWHPELDNLLAVVAKDKITLINMPPTSGVFCIMPSYMSMRFILLCIGVFSCGVAWHPELDNLLAVVAKDNIAFINVPPTSGVFA